MFMIVEYYLISACCYPDTWRNVHGIGAMAQSEQLLVDEKTGRVLNGTLLDYKMPTTNGFIGL